MADQDRTEIRYDVTFGGTTQKWMESVESTTGERLRVGNQTIERVYAPLVPSLPGVDTSVEIDRGSLRKPIEHGESPTHVSSEPHVDEGARVHVDPPTDPLRKAHEPSAEEYGQETLVQPPSPEDLARAEAIPDLDAEVHETSMDDLSTKLGDQESDDQTIPDMADRIAFGTTMVPEPSGQLRILQTTRGPSKAPAEGDVIDDRYVITRRIASGGMGVIFEVNHVRLGKAFAAKILKPEHATDEGISSGFFREAKLASSLDHANLISVLDFGEDAIFGPFIIMELVEGETLENLLLKRSKLSARRACDIVLQIAEALDYIHRRNILHCDLKPRNVMLSPVHGDSRRKHFVKLIDFGLARRRENVPPDRLFGTPEYIPPEAARREPVTPSSDVYSLGIIFFELMTGGVPWTGSVREVVLKHLSELPPTLGSRLGKQVDPALEKLVRTSLAKDPRDRHRDMSAFLYELRTVMDMMGFPKSRHARRASAVNSGTSRAGQPFVARLTSNSAGAHEPAHRDSQHSQLVHATFDTFRLPIATIASDGTIVAANSAFSKFLVGMLVSLVGTNIHQTALAAGWSSIHEDLAFACDGDPVGRVIEMDVRESDVPVALQMWLEPVMPGYASFSVYPLGMVEGVGR